MHLLKSTIALIVFLFCCYALNSCQCGYYADYMVTNKAPHTVQVQWRQDQNIITVPIEPDKTRILFRKDVPGTNGPRCDDPEIVAAGWHVDTILVMKSYSVPSEQNYMEPRHWSANNEELTSRAYVTEAEFL